MNDYNILIGIGCFIAGLLTAYWLKSKITSQKVKAAEGEAARFIEESQKKAETLLKEADFDMILPKPFPLKELVDSVKNLVRVSSPAAATA